MATSEQAAKEPTEAVAPSVSLETQSTIISRAGQLLAVRNETEIRAALAEQKAEQKRAERVALQQAIATAPDKTARDAAQAIEPAKCLRYK